MRRDYKQAHRFKKHKIRDHRRRTGKFKNPFFNVKTEITTKWSVWKTRFILGGVGIVAAVLLYFIFFSPYFYINKVNVEGLESIPGNDFQNLVDEHLNSRWLLIFPNNNALSLRKGSLAKKIGERYVLDELVIDRDFPNVLNIKVKEKISNAILTIGPNYFFLDTHGLILRRINENEVYPGLSAGPFSGEVPEFKNVIAELNLPLIYDQSGDQVEIGQQFLTPEKYAKILNSREILSLYTPYELDFYKINNIDVNWFKIVTKDGWEMHVDLDKNIQTQIVKIFTFIKEQGINPSDYNYFNARYEDRIYYK